MGYPSAKRKNADSKVFMNLAVRTVVKKNNITRGLATVLDDHNLQSSKTCRLFKKVIITQNDKSVCKQINKHIHLNNLSKNTECHYKDYADIDNKVLINLDHADFCSTWESNRDSVYKRLHDGMYADKSILRLTVSMRGMTDKHGKRKGMTVDKCVKKIEDDIQKHAHGYKIVPLTMKQWGMPLKANGFCPADCGDSIAYTYGTMINMIFLITCN